ncbi:hypothetical protein [Dactylosporangium sp. CA-092794]|uniref:hypothetical protein n=1 Tax=Dactylosporangium sp. CA-092794 TaxID=3239929 RepID=UPI003D8D3C69
MMVKQPQGLGAARIAALVVIGLATVAVVHFGRSTADRAAVPAGAQAGELSLHACTYDTERGALAADCGLRAAGCGLRHTGRAREPRQHPQPADRAAGRARAGHRRHARRAGRAAWLGLLAAGPLGALAGAPLAANLVLLLADVARDRTRAALPAQ